MTGQVQMTSLDVGSLCLHDAQLDYYGKRAAVVSGAPVQPDDASGLPEGDFTVHIWDVTEGQQKPVAQLKGHEGPVWKVAWAHPKFGSLLATCSYDMKVIIWKEVNGQWTKAYVDSSHTASVNEIEFCPFEHGLRLACASSDGMVSVLTYEPQQALWRRSVFQAHQCGAQSVSWAPVCQRDLGHGPPAIRLATGGCDNSVSIWKCEAEVWSQEMPALMPGHTDWVRKVAWRPDGTSTIASGGWDKQVVIWKQEMEGHPWRQLTKLPMAGKVEGLAWSVTGSLLAVSYDSGDVTLYRETDDGDAWEEIGKCNEKGYTDIPRANAAVNAISHSAPPPPAADGFAAQNAVNAAFDQGPDAAAQQAQQQSVLESFGMM